MKNPGPNDPAGAVKYRCGDTMVKDNANMGIFPGFPGNPYFFFVCAGFSRYPDA